MIIKSVNLETVCGITSKLQKMNFQNLHLQENQT